MDLEVPSAQGFAASVREMQICVNRNFPFLSISHQGYFSSCSTLGSAQIPAARNHGNNLCLQQQISLFREQNNLEKPKKAKIPRCPGWKELGSLTLSKYQEWSRKIIILFRLLMLLWHLKNQKMLRPKLAQFICHRFNIIYFITSIHMEISLKQNCFESF